MPVVRLMESNVYSFQGTVLIAGSCLPQVFPEAFAELARQADMTAELCLEAHHLNMAVTKIAAILGTGQVERLLLASVDRSPHCTQLHYIKHEIERTMPRHAPIESFVVADGRIVRVTDAAVEHSKSLARLSEERKGL